MSRPHADLVGGANLDHFHLPIEEDGTVLVPPDIQAVTGWSSVLYPSNTGRWSNFPPGKGDI